MAALDLKARYKAAPAYAVGQMLPLADIRTDGGTQARAGTDDATVTEYTQAMQGGADFPLIVVFHDGESYWLADGFHRAAAAQQIGRTELRAEIQSGTRRDAILYACGANASHGMRRTNADKRRAVERLLRDDEWKQWSNSEIARRCQVGHPLVAELRQELYPEDLQDSRTVTRGGTTYQQRTPAPKSSAINRPDGSPMEDDTSAPDLPPEFAVIQRRYEKHGHALTASWDGTTQRYVVRKDGGTGVVRGWPDVLAKLERLEAEQATPPDSTATEMEIKRLCAICGARYLGIPDLPYPTATRYRIAFVHPGGGGDYLADEAITKLRAACAAREIDPAHVERLEAQIEADRIPEASMVIAPPAPTLPAVPPRPKRPVSADASAVIAYLKQMETYASALESFIMALQKRIA